MSVYFAESGPYMKIGFSDNPIQRNGTVTRNGMRPADLPFRAKTDLFGWIPGDRKVERRMHERFANIRVAGEWFWSEREQADEIIWADPRGIHIHRMSAQAVFAMHKHPTLTRAEVAEAGIPVEAVPLEEALEHLFDFMSSGRTSPAAGTNPEAAARKGSQSAASVTPAPPAPSPRSGGAGQDSSDADAVGALASEGTPRWSAVDDDTESLLDLLSEEHPAIPEEDRQWEHFVAVLQKVAAEHDGLIDQNLTRPLLRGQIRPARTGSFFHRAARQGLIRAEGWNESDDREQRNGGKPIRIWRWLGGGGPDA